jgi:lipoprotein-anchoring transpeptidase ErfK/SrfK
MVEDSMAKKLIQTPTSLVLKLLFCLLLAGQTILAPAVEAKTVPAAAFAVRGVLAPDRPLEAGDYIWEAAGVPAGQTSIVVDLSAQLIYVYRGGIEIGRAYIIYGDDDKPTPTGTFSILEKKARHISNIYHVPMPYMLRLTWTGIAIHESEVDDEYATHGCIGIPEEFSALLFSVAKVGDPVMVTRGWMRNAYAHQSAAR